MKNKPEKKNEIKKAKSPREITEQFLQCWVQGDIPGFFFSLQLSYANKMLASRLLAPFGKQPIGFKFMSEQIPKSAGKFSVVMRDMYFKIDFGNGRKLHRIRCVCEGVVEGTGKIVAMQIKDGGQWGVNLPSITQVEK